MDLELVIEIPLTNEHNISYFGNIGIGTPPIVQRVSFNTAAHEIWIPNNIQGMNNSYVVFRSSTCDRRPDSQANLQVRPFYDLNMTATRRTDVFWAGNQTMRSVFCAVYDVNPVYYSEYTTWTGIVGLSLSPPAPHCYAPPIWSTMMNENMLFGNIFSVWMRNYNVFGPNGGAIVFGAANSDHFDEEEGHEHYDLVEGCSEWMIQMSFVAVGQNREIQGGKALIHTASPYIFGPSRIIRAINTQILGGRRRRRRHQQIIMGEEVEDEDSHVFTHDEMLTAHNMPNVSFVFSGSDRVYTLRPNEYIIQVGGEYVSAFRPMHFSSPIAEHYTLGMPFLRLYHSVFNFEERKIGFAPSNP
ncbi:hypothetical protein Bca4012_028212 [Brassica carinata]|uniref:Peptidase A1 domain-containing protein n=1 Tax=Brassica carinata TaxID=52824 RepID=A0A8X8AWR0_BRACI|nr:hypothetical protein Bca52824_025245 [Brassica carinata]